MAKGLYRRKGKRKHPRVRNPIAQELWTPKFRLKVIDKKNKKWEDYDDDYSWGADRGNEL